MIETVTTTSRPMLYITTRTSERASSVATTIKLSLDQVLRFMDEQGIAPAGDPLAMFSDWNGRLVTIEAGYPVDRAGAALADGRVQAGWTPAGSAARSSYDQMAADYARQHEAFTEELRAGGYRLSGLTWEVYTRNAADPARPTALYAQLLLPPAPAEP